MSHLVKSQDVSGMLLEELLVYTHTKINKCQWPQLDWDLSARITKRVTVK